MPSECPNCRAPIPRMRLFMTSIWGRWQCSSCGSVLGIDVRRRLLAMIPYLLLLVVLMKFLNLPGYGLAVALPVVIGAGLLNFFFFDRPVVHERTGFRCRTCGYDLRGQKEGRCPECGADFELEALAAHKTAVPLPPKRVRTGWRIAALVIASGISRPCPIALIAGILYLRAARARTVTLPSAPTPTTTPAAPPPAAVPDP